MVRPALQAVEKTQPALAQKLDEGWTTPLSDWSRALWADPPENAGFEPPFRASLVQELTGRVPDAERLISDIERVGAVLTPHHVCPTNGATFGAIDRIATISAPGPVLVMAWSGVPMSNTAASGNLCFTRAEYGELLQPGPELKRQAQAAKDRARDGVTERRIALLPPELRDALVYGCPLPSRVAEVLAAASPRLSQVIPLPEPGESYPGWALRVCEGLQRRVLGKSDLYYVDLNRVAARYMAEVLQDERHPLTRLLSADPATPALAALGSMSWFYARRPGKRESVETHTGGGAPAALRTQLLDGSLCPGLVPVFGALRLCSRIRLLGGFRQVNYLEEIARAWQEAGAVDSDGGVPGRLVTGRLVGRDGAALYPLDLAVGAAQEHALPQPSDPMSVLWEPILARLAG